jgi:hypothetical protein
MISYNSKYIGSAIISMIDSFQDGLYIKRIIDDKSGFYLLNNTLPILCKYSTKRTNPWSFSIRKDVLDIYFSLVKLYKECLIILICGIDGIISLDYSEVCNIININIPSEQKRISATRKLGEMYYISGSDGNLKNKVAQKSVADNLQRHLFLEDAKT